MANYKEIFKDKNKNEKIIKTICPQATHTSGIYSLHRIDENGIKYGYIGLASKSLLTRLAEHLSGYQHIDLSIKKHGLYNEINCPYGYKVNIVCECPPEQLDEKEAYYIKLMADKGYQLRNKQSGGRFTGRYNINDSKAPKGYHDGIWQGKETLCRELRHIIDKYLVITLKKDNKLSQKALEKFKSLLENKPKDQKSKENEQNIEEK